MLFKETDFEINVGAVEAKMPETIDRCELYAVFSLLESAIKAYKPDSYVDSELVAYKYKEVVIEAWARLVHIAGEMAMDEGTFIHFGSDLRYNG